MEESEKPEKLKRCLQKDTAGPVPARALECCLDAERNGKHRGVTLGNTKACRPKCPDYQLISDDLFFRLLSSCVLRPFSAE